MKEPADCSKDPFPDFEELLANLDLEYESVRSRSMTKKNPKQDPKESSVPNKKSPGTPASDASQNLKEVAKLGDASESISAISHARRDITSFSLPEIGYYSFSRKYHRHPKKQYIPVFDMRYTIGSIILPCPDVNISPSTEFDEMREDVSNLLKVPKEHVLFLYKEISHLQTNHLGILIIVDPVHSESHILTLLLVDRDVDMESENWSHSAYKMNTRNICCVLFPKGEKVFKLKQELQEKYKLPMDHFALILNKKKVKETYKIEDVVKSYDLLILEKHMPIDIHVVWRQYPNFKQVIDIVGISSLHTIGSLKKLLIKAFSELQPILLTVENICFSKEDVLLDNDVILSYIQGLPQRYHSDRHKVSLKLHFVHPIYTWFKIDTITAARIRIVEVVCVNQKSSTGQLRAEVAKICMCRSQALKLVVSGKKIPEKERIEEIPFLQEGCTIKASVSSQIQINITVMSFSGQKEENIEQFQVKIYKLDTVLKLKQIVVKRLQSPVEIYMCDLKKECLLEESRFLRDYGIVNDTEIMACILKNRIQVNLVIPKTKRKMQVFIDEPKSTTVQDFLVYAKTQGLVDVQYSELRLLYKDRCLPLESSLCDANVRHETMLVITTVAKMSRGTIIMCPEKTGEALCVTGIVIRGRIYYAIGPADESNDLESHNEPAVPAGMMHLLKSSSTICNLHNNPSPALSVVIPSQLIIEDANRKISEGEEDSCCNRKSESAGHGGYYQQEEHSLALSQLEEKKVKTESSSNLQQELKQVSGNRSEGCSSESSDIGTLFKSNKTKRLKYLKRARNLMFKSESSADDAVGPQHSLVLNSDKSEVELDNISSAGQSSVTSKSVMTCGPHKNSCTQSRIGTEITTVASTCAASCSTMTQSSTGPAALNYINTGQISMQSTEGDDYKGGYSVKFYQKGSEMWRCCSTEEIVQVGNTPAVLDPSAIMSSRVTDMEFSSNRHRSTHGLPHSSSDVLDRSLVEHQGFTPELLHSIAEAVGVSWRKLARKLSIPDEKIENIDTNSRFTSCDEKCYQILLCWCNASRHATKQLLASKLIACELRLIAVRYLSDYVQDNYNTV